MNHAINILLPLIFINAAVAELKQTTVDYGEARDQKDMTQTIQMRN